MFVRAEKNFILFKKKWNRLIYVKINPLKSNDHFLRQNKFT